MNYLNVVRSAGDGIRVTFCDSPVQVTNSTVSYNRGHGIVIDRTFDGRVFINETRVEWNYGDGIRYIPQLGLSYHPVIDGTVGRDSVAYYEPEKPEVDICSQRNLDGRSRLFPRTFSASLINGTMLLADSAPFPCYAVRVP
ncbi:unnamed protein product [Soboliphyme baturini]|uniref:Beta_helix domain-containing protein n=1 Tax=Soboliphyme baturini TaxID=241478 RepID=A0A183J783_9BILA|nr:unnamed protein product [Soboliphyme baturini]